MITSTVTRSGTPPKVIADKIPEAIQAGVYNVSLTALSLSEKRIQRIYSRAIPTEGQVRAYEWSGAHGRIGKHGRVWTKKTWKSSVASRPAWTRTGNLRRSLGLKYGEFRGGGAYGIITAKRKGMYGEATEKYKPRHDLGVGWKPVAPAIGVIRKNPWWQEAAERLEPQILNRFDEGFKAVMNK